jgi:hypothetical protein
MWSPLIFVDQDEVAGPVHAKVCAMIRATTQDI